MRRYAVQRASSQPAARSTQRAQPTGHPSGPEQVLSLHRTIGNQAVVGLLNRSPHLGTVQRQVSLHGKHFGSYEALQTYLSGGSESDRTYWEWLDSRAEQIGVSEIDLQTIIVELVSGADQAFQDEWALIEHVAARCRAFVSASEEKKASPKQDWQDPELATVVPDVDPPIYAAPFTPRSTAENEKLVRDALKNDRLLISTGQSVLDNLFGIHTKKAPIGGSALLEGVPLETYSGDAPGVLIDSRLSSLVIASSADLGLKGKNLAEPGKFRAMAKKMTDSAGTELKSNKNYDAWVKEYRERSKSGHNEVVGDHPQSALVGMVFTSRVKVDAQRATSEINALANRFNAVHQLNLPNFIYDPNTGTIDRI